MTDETGPNLLVVGGDSKRLQWLTHHVTSHWPDAQVITVPAEESASLSRLIAERAPAGADAACVVLHSARRKRRRNVGGAGPEERRQGLPAAGTHYTRSIVGGD